MSPAECTTACYGMAAGRGPADRLAADMRPRRVGVIFGGRSGEHEVSLASAASVIAALQRRGHTVVPVGIARDGRWVVGGDPMRVLSDEVRRALPAGEAGGARKSLADRADTQTAGNAAL